MTLKLWLSLFTPEASDWLSDTAPVWLTCSCFLVGRFYLGWLAAGVRWVMESLCILSPEEVVVEEVWGGEDVWAAEEKSRGKTKPAPLSSGCALHFLPLDEDESYQWSSVTLLVKVWKTECVCVCFFSTGAIQWNSNVLRDDSLRRSSSSQSVWKPVIDQQHIPVCSLLHVLIFAIWSDDAGTDWNSMC